MTRAAAPLPGGGRLRRLLSPAGVLALTLAALSPAGSVYVTGAAVLHLAGTGAALAMLGGGVAVMVLALLCAELGLAFPHAGGVYHGIGEVLGQRCSAAALALGIVTAPALIAFVAIGFATYVREMAPSLPLLPVAIGAIGLATTVGVLRLRTGMWVTGALLAAELLALLGLTALEWRHAARGLATILQHPVVASAHGAMALTGAVPLVLATIAAAYACSGSTLALNFAEELEGDRAAVGRIIAWGSVLAVALVSVPIIGVVVGTPDLAETLSSDAPIAASVRALAGPVAARTFAAIVALAMLDHVAGAMLAYSRFVFAAARSLGAAKGSLTALSRLHRSSGAPVAAVLVLGGAAMLLTLIGERGLLLVVSGDLITPALMIVAVLAGRRRAQTGVRSFRSPCYPVLPWIGLGILALFFTADLLDVTARYSIGILLLCAGTAAAMSPKSRG